MISSASITTMVPDCPNRPGRRAERNGNENVPVDVNVRLYDHGPSAGEPLVKRAGVRDDVVGRAPGRIGPGHGVADSDRQIPGTESRDPSLVTT